MDAHFSKGPICIKLQYSNIVICFVNKYAGCSAHRQERPSGRDIAPGPALLQGGEDHWVALERTIFTVMIMPITIAMTMIT